MHYSEAEGLAKQNPRRNRSKYPELNKFLFSTATRKVAITSLELVTDSRRTDNVIVSPETVSNRTHEANLHSHNNHSGAQLFWNAKSSAAVLFTDESF